MIVLLRDGRADLLLSEVKYNADGSVKSGFVVNGAWNYEVRGGEELAKSGNYIATRWPARTYTLVEVPKEVKGDYNEIMRWAEEQIEDKP